MYFRDSEEQNFKTGIRNFLQLIVSIGATSYSPYRLVHYHCTETYCQLTAVTIIINSYVTKHVSFGMHLIQLIQYFKTIGSDPSATCIIVKYLYI